MLSQRFLALWKNFYSREVDSDPKPQKPTPGESKTGEAAPEFRTLSGNAIPPKKLPGLGYTGVALPVRRDHEREHFSAPEAFSGPALLPCAIERGASWDLKSST